MELLPDKWISILINTPETGMGYHLVDIETECGKCFQRVILNCKYIVPIEHGESQNIKSLKVVVRR